MRDFDAAVASINGSPLTLDGSSADWEPIPASRLDLPGDSQFAASQPPLDELRVVAEAEDDTQVWVDDLELLRLSTAYLHDTEGLREVRLPDGTRMGMERDRYGRVNRWVDPLGRTTVVRYDSLNRVVAVVDPLGQVTSYAYDEVSNLVSFTDARARETTYLYDELNRLQRITYPDANYEEFSYTPAGDLASYTNARGQERVFAYDLAHRLESIEFQTDMSTLEFSYDEVGNLIAQTERNGDQVFYSYDALNRLIDVLRVPGVGSDTPGWSHAHQYDENGNRVAFSTDGPAYGSAVYGTSLYGITEATGARYDDGTYDDGTYASHPLGWSVPSPGYDEMNRLPVFADPRGREVSFSFDADGRRTGISYPNGVDLSTAAQYDIVGRLLSLTTTDTATELLKLEYGYSPASERIAMRHNDDTWEYRLDELGRLVEEAVNRMVDRTADQFAQGEFDLVELDPETDSIRLLAFSDTLADGLWNTDRWRVAVLGPESETGVPHYALGVRAFQDQGLQLTFPRGGTNLVIYADPPVHDKYGVDPALNYESDFIAVAAEHRRKLHGDFDIKVEFSDLQFAMHRNYSGCHVKLAVSTQPWGMASTYGASFGRRARSLSPGAGGSYDLYYFQRSPSSAPRRLPTRPASSASNVREPPAWLGPRAFSAGYWSRSSPMAVWKSRLLRRTRAIRTRWPRSRYIRRY